jgi:hypothetical protein
VKRSAEIAFTLFAHVGGEKDGDGGSQLGVAHARGKGKQPGEAGGVVASSGSHDAGFEFDGLDGQFGGENGVQVGGEQDEGRGRCSQVRRCLTSGTQFGQSVAGFVNVRIGEAEGMELLQKPRGARLLTERRSGDAQDFQLPAADLQLMDMQPMERAMDRRGGGEARDAKLSGGGHFVSGTRY